MPPPPPQSTPPFTISPATTPSDLAAIKSLFQAYATWLALDLSFQSFAAELATLPGAYAPPSGRLFLARSSTPNGTTGEAIGCVGLRPLPSGDGAQAEMKRLYVLPEARGKGVGVALARAAIEGAREAGYGEVRLDTLGSMEGAISMYRRLGFEECGRYYETPLEGTVFLRLDLRRGKGSG